MQHLAYLTSLIGPCLDVNVEGLRAIRAVGTCQQDPLMASLLRARVRVWFGSRRCVHAHRIRAGVTWTLMPSPLRTLASAWGN